MWDFFTNNAIRNVWCSPDRDLQSIIEPAKVTPLGGAWNSAFVLWDNITLPLQNTKFHIYQIGQLNPRLMGLFPSVAKWEKISDACNAGNLIVDIYSITGIQMPRTQVWYQVTYDQNLLIAVQQQPRINIDFDKDTLFFRFYTNAFFQELNNTAVVNTINVQGMTVGNTADIINLQTQYNASLLLPGSTMAFVNGFLVSKLDLISAQPGDVVEFVYDSSVYKVETFNLSNLPTFNSVLDSKIKYLLHYPNADLDDGIDHHDDIDFYIVNPSTDGSRYSGVYFHRNNADAVRQVTHKDYSMVSSYVENYIVDRPEWSSPNNVQIIMFVRHSGFQRPLVNENNRIKELYKMSDANIVEAMLGVSSNVSNWTAPILENSPYTRIMRSTISELNLQLVQDAYGYNAMAKLYADTPSPIINQGGLKIIAGPYGFTNTSVAYEYDVNGQLLQWGQNIHGSEYITANQATQLVEMITGTAGTLLDETYDTTNLTLKPMYDYRFYVCEIVSGTPNNKWIDVTGTSKYIINNGIVNWNLEAGVEYGMIRSNAIILAYDLNLQVTDGLLKFDLTSQQTRAGVTQNWIMQIPMGDLDLFLNGKSLIEGLDYFVNFPHVVIVNKEYLVNVATKPQHITVRFTGFCKSDLTRDMSEDIGFIKYGLLSNNNRFDLRDDRIMRIVVGGALYNRSQLIFAETNSGVTVPNAMNGVPYLIRDIVPMMSGQLIGDTMTLRAQSQAIDKVVSDYMTLKMPEPTFTTPDVIENIYRVYSPFLCKIINDMIHGILNDPLMKLNYDDNDVVNLCAPYTYLLASDPTQPGLQPDRNFVVIQPHNLETAITINLYQYKFLTRVVALYMNHLVALSQFISISS